MSPLHSELFILTGPSAAGKTSLAEGLLARSTGYERVVTATDRAPRYLPHLERYEDHREYRFMSTEDFLRGVADDEFYEHAEVYGNLKGVPKVAIDGLHEKGVVPMLVLDMQGLATWKERFGTERVFSAFVLPDVAQVDGSLVVPPSVIERGFTPEFAQRLETAVRARIFSREGDTGDPADQERRLAALLQEVREGISSPHVDVFLRNPEGSLERAVQALDSILHQRFDNRTRRTF